jgi:hypothetical protein
MPLRRRTSPTEPTTREGSDSAVVRWNDPTEDPALLKILKSASTRARHDLPDVLVSSDELPPEFDEVLALSAQRLRSLQADAQAAAAPHVERVLGQHADTAGTYGTARSLSRSARATASRHSVQSIADALRIAIEAQRAYTEQALSLLDDTVRHHHRFAPWLIYTVPAVAVPDDLYEIGQTRLIENSNPLDAGGPPPSSANAATASDDLDAATGESSTDDTHHAA